MARAQWETLPDSVRDRIQDHTGPVLKAIPAAGGLMPGVAATLHLEHGGRVFLKAAANDNPAAQLYARERWAAAVLPPHLPTPAMRWSSSTGGWTVMVFDCIDGGREADLSPGSPDVPAVLATLGDLNRALSPCLASDAPSVAENVAALQAKAAHLLAKPHLDDRGLYEVVLAGFDVGVLDGDTLLHYDLHPGNLQVVDGGGIQVIDWSFACRGAAWIDAVMLGPRLIEAGHTPDQVEALLASVPAWKTAHQPAVTSLVALWTLFRVYKAEFGPEDVRDARARAAQAGLSWLEHRTG